MQNWEEIQTKLKEAGQGGKLPDKSEITSAEAGINTLEDLMNLSSGSYSRSDPTLWNINGQNVRIDPKLYQDYTDYNQAWHYSDIYQKHGIKESAQYKEEWTKDYLKNYNAGAVSSAQPTADMEPKKEELLPGFNISPEAIWQTRPTQPTIRPQLPTSSPTGFDIRKPNLDNRLLPQGTRDLISRSGINTVWGNSFFGKLFNR